MSKKQREHVDNQSFANNLFETSNTNTPIYIKKEKEKEKLFLLQKKKKKKRESRKMPWTAGTSRPPLRAPTTTPCGTTAWSAGSWSTGKKPPHLPPYPLGFAVTLPRIWPENLRKIRHKPWGINKLRKGVVGSYLPILLWIEMKNTHETWQNLSYHDLSRQNLTETDKTWFSQFHMSYLCFSKQGKEVPRTRFPKPAREERRTDSENKQKITRLWQKL